VRAVTIHAEAAEEALAAGAWYESERAGLGKDFFAALDAALDLLEQEVVPLVASPRASAERQIKHLLLRRFPYALMILERPNEYLVVAIAHTARRPGYWRSRVPRA
jgi:toxin ParE1/3/4